jgi:CxxC motif-containing protein (DUF1111 family)
MTFLAPITRGHRQRGRDGERTFAAVGCAACHIQALMTGSNVNPLFDRKVVPLCSDLLLHTIGTGDGINKPIPRRAGRDRTPALWGLRFRRPLLRRQRRDDRRRIAGMRAGRSRATGDRLDTVARSALLAFLQSL